MTTTSAGNLVIRASAGSGKTFRLTNHYLALLAAGVPPAQVWAATFTRKAAGEILDRIVSRLTEAAAAETKASELAEQIGHSGLTQSDFAQLLRRFLADLHRLRIGTLDSLFLALAGAFPLELGLPPAWGICEESEAAIELENALDAVLAGDDHRVEQLARLYERLSPGAAKRAVREDLLGRVEVLYAAYLAVPRAGWQTEPPPNPDDSVSAIIADVRGIALPADKRFVAAVDKDMEKAAASQWTDFIAAGLAASLHNGKNVYYKKPIPQELADCYARLTAMAAFASNRDLATETGAVHEFLDQFHQHLAAVRGTSGGLRFDDIARALADGLRPAEEGFDYRIDGRVGHLLLDEFQDTSTLQWRVLKPLAQRAIVASGSVFGVGDVKQAIYGWRGGRAELLDKLPGELGGVATQEMDQSRRSAQTVIDCVNIVFLKLDGCVEDEAAKQAAVSWQERFREHTTAREEIPGHVHLETGPAQEEDESTADRRGRHYAWVAGRIAELVRLKPTATIGVLCRKNPTVGRMIFELRQLGMPASEEGGNPITDSPAVEGILSLLTLADHPGDTVVAFHLATEPFATMLRQRGYDPADPLATARRVRTALVAGGYGPVVAGWAESLKPICPRSDCDRLDQLIEFADAYQPRATLRPADFVASVREYKVATLTTSQVRVLTLHKAKGLEYDAVVLPELDITLKDQHHPAFIVADPEPPELAHGFVGRRVSAKLWPLANEQAKEQTRIAAQRAVEESLSLLYVALTRPREALYAYPPGPLSRSHSDTWDTVLMNALCGAEASGITDREAKTVIFCTGDPNWQPQKTAGRPSVAAATRAPIWFRDSEPARRRVEWVAPSRQEGGRRVLAANLFGNADGAGRRSGTLHHAWFAAIEWLDEGEPTDEALRVIARHLPYEGDNLDEQIAMFRTALRRPAVRKCLSKDSYTGVERVETERPFVVRDGSHIVSGRLDRIVWLRHKDGTLAAEVIDYKTDAISMAELSERVEYYRPQVESYLRAVATLGNLPATRVTAALVFTAIGQSENIRLLGPHATPRTRQDAIMDVPEFLGVEQDETALAEFLT
jgi:ATP-dependent exoDNAse (exonuclease V) beta subunit